MQRGVDFPLWVRGQALIRLTPTSTSPGDVVTLAAGAELHVAPKARAANGSGAANASAAGAGGTWLFDVPGAGTEVLPNGPAKANGRSNGHHAAAATHCSADGKQAATSAGASRAEGPAAATAPRALTAWLRLQPADDSLLVDTACVAQPLDATAAAASSQAGGPPPPQRNGMMPGAPTANGPAAAAAQPQLMRSWITTVAFVCAETLRRTGLTAGAPVRVSAAGGARGIGAATLVLLPNPQVSCLTTSTYHARSVDNNENVVLGRIHGLQPSIHKQCPTEAAVHDECNTCMLALDRR